ncbi:coiled-coil domain-containing protein 149 isoform X2 [Daktulosphaira vitifoliae]|uniref:coiled-coil domain-containing protein 149 isoform X2 n=1 Tax=Daktulosphaira vitifoliae TaxID=58002 RepID=UPI0021AAB1A0|nr:coiled-coil domain-containing protein 149 isoform X2 [Daktulosphaira vitifoliae]
MDSNIIELKLKSKTEALNVLTDELEKCRIERDHYKIILENQMLHSTFNISSSGINYDKLINQLREENKLLRLETEDMRQRLRDAHGDNQVLRTGGFIKSCMTTLLSNSNSKEEDVKNLEIINSKYQQLKIDFALLLDDKQELIMERDGLQKKVRRLNNELAAALKLNKNQHLVDIDSLLTENKYLNERLHLEIAEREILAQNKSFYQKSRPNKLNEILVSKINNTTLTRKLETCKQLQQILESGNLQTLFSNDSTLAELRKLCQTLFETLQDQILAFNHQKKTNKILAKRLEDLEKNLKNFSQGNAIMSPSQVLLNNCCHSSDETDEDNSFINEDVTVNSHSNENKELSNNLNLDQYPNEVNTLPNNLQQLVTNAMKNIKKESSNLSNADDQYH